MAHAKTIRRHDSSSTPMAPRTCNGFFVYQLLPQFVAQLWAGCSSLAATLVVLCHQLRHLDLDHYHFKPDPVSFSQYGVQRVIGTDIDERASQRPQPGTQ